MRYLFGDCCLDTARYELHRAGVRIPLRSKVFHLLTYLITHRDRVVLKDELVEHLWPDQFIGDTALKSCILAARKAVGDKGHSQRIIQTFHSHGYRFVAAVTAEEQAPSASATPSELFRASAPPAPPVETVPDPGTGMPRPAVHALEHEHKQVTVLWCTLAHATTLATQLGPETMHALMQEVFALAQRIMQRYEGTITQYMGDGFLALFGAPVAHEDHARRAVLAALELQQHLHDCRTGLALPQEATLAVCIGLHTGPVVVGYLESDPQRLYTAVGETTHVVTRLQPLAAPGTVVISEATYRLVHDEIWADACGGLDGDATAAPMAVYAVRDTIQRRSGVPGHHARNLSPFVGRTRELATLHERLAYATQGQGQAVGIVGEAGMGKSRLLYEFAQSLTGQAVTYREGHCLAYGSATPYLPVCDLLRQHCGITRADGVEAMTAKVCQAVQEAGVTSAAEPFLLLQLLDIPIETRHVAHLSPQAQRARTFALLRQMFLHASQRQPLILAVENGHWLDATSEEWLTTLIARLLGASILLLVTYRPGYRPPWLEQSTATQIALPRLLPQDSLTLVQSVAQKTSLPDHLAQMIVAKAGGNPFFLEELTWAVVEGGQRADSPPIPETIQAVLAARLDRLPPVQKRLVQAAAVIGTEVPVPLLQAVTAMPEEDLTEGLRHLQAAEFLYESRLLPELTYTFKHVLTREVAYASLPRVRRQALHTAAGEALEALYAERLDEVVDRLAHHFASTESPEKAIAYLTRFAAKAARTYAHVEAVQALQEALRHAGRLSGVQQDRCLLELMLRQALSLAILGRYQEIQDLLLGQRQRLERLAEPLLAGAYYFRLSMNYGVLGEHTHAVQYAWQAIRAGRRCNDAATLGKAHYALAHAEYLRGQPQPGSGHARQAVVLLERTGERQHLGLAYWLMAAHFLYLGEFAAGLEAAAHAGAVGRALEDLRIQSFGAGITGWILALRGEWESGLEACHRGLAYAPDPLVTGAALTYMGCAYLEKGDAAEAIPLLEQAVRLTGHLRRRAAQSRHMAFLGEAYCVHGDLDKAHELACQGLQVGEDTQNRYAVGWAQRTLGYIAQARDNLKEARRCLEEALQTFTTLAARFEMARTHLDLAALAQAQGNLTVAITHLRTAYGLFTILRVPHYIERTAQLIRALDVASEIIPTPAYCDVSPALKSAAYSARLPLDRTVRKAYGRGQ
jgi:class 3 adenylate cyclase/tetratricopeptide (TPR) repeat protein